MTVTTCKRVGGYKTFGGTEHGSRLVGVVVSVLANGPKGCGFEPGQGGGF
jgi:hypothetical protein